MYEKDVQNLALGLYQLPNQEPNYRGFAETLRLPVAKANPNLVLKILSEKGEADLIEQKVECKCWQILTQLYDVPEDLLLSYLARFFDSEVDFGALIHLLRRKCS